MSDRQLLEDAARAAGIKLVWLEGRPFYADSSLGNEWNPLEDSGQALELAVKLGLVVDTSRPSAGEPFKLHYYSMDDLPDRGAATRRAIVRAAAEIGNGMA